MDESRIAELSEEVLAALGDGRNVRALALADQLASAAPGNAAVRTLRAQALLQSDAGEDAVEEARRAVELDPDSAQAQAILGIAAWRSNKLTLAQYSLERAIELSGRRPGLLVDYAWFMAAERGPRLALAAASEAVRAANHSSTAWAALGMAQFRLHRNQEAEASLQRALALDADDPYAQSAMAALLHEKRHDRQAVGLTRLLENMPGTEHIVAGIREEAHRRQLAKRLVERDALPPVVFEFSVRRWVWPLAAVMLVAAMWLAVRPQTLAVMLPCTILPILFVWLVHKVFAMLS